MPATCLDPRGPRPRAAGAHPRRPPAGHPGAGGRAAHRGPGHHPRGRALRVLRGLPAAERDALLALGHDPRLQRLLPAVADPLAFVAGDGGASYRADMVGDLQRLVRTCDGERLFEAIDRLLSAEALPALLNALSGALELDVVQRLLDSTSRSRCGGPASPPSCATCWPPWSRPTSRCRPTSSGPDRHHAAALRRAAPVVAAGRPRRPAGAGGCWPPWRTRCAATSTASRSAPRCPPPPSRCPAIRSSPGCSTISSPPAPSTSPRC
ncbi:MAG: hypothetical protein R3F43_19450 [bacterium]